MSAKVKPGAFDGWVAFCRDCKESVAGGMAAVDMWADIHNEQVHAEEMRKEGRL